MIQAWTSAFFLGLLGSLHCVGMCGPLMLVLPVQRWGPALLYHTGRIAMYTLGGLVFGLLGRRIWLAGWQQGFSITLGVLVLLFLFIPRLRPGTAKFYAPVQRLIGRLWQKTSRGKFLLLGMGNGLLPCGMVYLAMAGALTRNGAVDAMGFMASFGMGTLPLLLALQYTGHRVSPPFRLQLRKALPYITGLMGILLILRGLDLGIPFISPMFSIAIRHPVSCH